MQAYSNPKRANDPYTLPDVEVYYFNSADIFADGSWTGTCRECVSKDVALADGFGSQECLCLPCAQSLFTSGWYWRACFPGCIPDGDPTGPFATQEEALADAQENADDDDEEEEA